jgi:hypothetical protein
MLTTNTSIASDGVSNVKYQDIDLHDLVKIDIETLRNKDVAIKVNYFEKDARLSIEKVLRLKTIANSLTLEVYGICAGECSLILLPNADQIIVHENANIFLTSSLVDVSVMEMSHALFGRSSSTVGLSVSSFKSAENDLEQRVGSASKFMEEISKLGKSPHHLIMHSMFTRGLRRRFSERCTFGFTFGILLDREYLSSEFYKVIYLPDEGIKENTLTNAVQAYKSELIVAEPFTFQITMDENLDKFDRKSCFSDKG